MDKLFEIEPIEIKETCRHCKYRQRSKLNQYSEKVIQSCALQKSKRSNSGFKTIKVTDKACNLWERVT